MALFLDGDIIKSHWKERRDWQVERKKGLVGRKKELRGGRDRKVKEEERT